MVRQKGSYLWYLYNKKLLLIVLCFFFFLIYKFRNLDDIKQESDGEYEDEETGDVDTKDETAPFGKKVSGIREQLVRAFPELLQVSCTSHA